MVTKDLILSKLKEVEDKERVRILYAVESGSRGWGFESKDSDYDVRFIYTHLLEWYLSIEDKSDVIEYPVSGSLDISGWDIKKALKLFKAFNPPLYEWLNSPIIYLENGKFAKKLRDLISKFYSPVACLQHYLSMAKGNYKAYLTGQKIKLKKYFYVLRPVFACMWIEDYKTMPPMEFEKIFNSQTTNSGLIHEVERLLERKRSGEELAIEDRIEVINNFLEEKIRYFEDYAKTMKIKQPARDDLLDNLFRETLRNYESLPEMSGD